jgi:lipopolysaccharide transport system permease protein
MTRTDEPTRTLPVVEIRPSEGWKALKLDELWEYRELLYFLSWREVKVRYKQTAIGAAWAILQPLLTMLIFSLFFGRLAKLPSDGVPYPLFSLAGLAPWTFFTNGLSLSSNSLVGNANLITKVYFPRLTVPISATLSGMVDFSLSFLMLCGLAAWYGTKPTMHIFWLPVFLLMAIATALGAGLWLSALNVEYRDVRYVVPFLLQFWMFGTPIAYATSIVPQQWRVLYGLNPMVGVVDGFRWALLGTSTAPGAGVWASVAMSLVLLISGALYFRRMETTFADVV